ncbi:MAG: PRD domain-containing protein [Angelakisella sp.]
MRILKAINNNVVSALDENGQEIIVTGKGIGFRAISGDLIPSQDVEKVFRMNDQHQTDRLKDLFASLPMQHMRLSDGIITYAKEKLGMHLNQSIYVTLTDHINFAVRRYKQGMPISNPLLMEVRRFYPQEYIIGQYALEQVDRELGVSMPPDEAASIALHIVNAEYDSPTMNETLNMTRLIQAIIELVRGFPGFTFDDTSMDYERFITHLKYLAQRLYRSEERQRSDPEFVGAIASIYPTECEYSVRVAKFVEQKAGHTLSPEEKSYLAVHLRRISRSQETKNIDSPI